MAKQQCPNCGVKKVTELVPGEGDAVKKKLHDWHVIHAPYDEYKVHVCEACGWYAATRWHQQNASQYAYGAILELMQPEPEPEPEPIIELAESEFEDEDND